MVYKQVRTAPERASRYDRHTPRRKQVTVISARSPRPHSATRALATIVLLAVVPALAGCIATGTDAATNTQYQPGIGANLRSGQVQLYNALVVDNGDGTGTVSVLISNSGDEPQKLDEVTATTSAGEDVDVTTAPAIVGANRSLSTGPAATAVLESDDVTAGSYVRLTFTFDRAGDVTIEAPVVARDETYADVAEKPGGKPAEDESVEEPAS
jgi:hypothetical protein